MPMAIFLAAGSWRRSIWPVRDILSFFASVARIGRTSITVKVEVYAERMRQQGRYVKVTQANLTYVAIDDQGKPCPVTA